MSATDDSEKVSKHKRRDEKAPITTEIINMIALEGGRFVRLHESTGFWEDINAAAKHDKISHSIRSARDPKRVQQAVRREKSQMACKPSYASND